MKLPVGANSGPVDAVRSIGRGVQRLLRSRPGGLRCRIQQGLLLRYSAPVTELEPLLPEHAELAIETDPAAPGQGVVLVSLMKVSALRLGVSLLPLGVEDVIGAAAIGCTWEGEPAWFVVQERGASWLRLLGTLLAGEPQRWDTASWQQVDDQLTVELTAGGVPVAEHIRVRAVIPDGSERPASADFLAGLSRNLHLQRLDPDPAGGLLTLRTTANNWFSQLRSCEVSVTDMTILQHGPLDLTAKLVGAGFLADVEYRIRSGRVVAAGPMPPWTTNLVR